MHSGRKKSMTCRASISCERNRLASRRKINIILSKNRHNIWFFRKYLYTSDISKETKILVYCGGYWDLFMKKNDIEYQESIAFSQWLSVNWYLHTHIPNESWLPPKVAMLVAIKKKKMGLSPWFPDYCIILKRWAILFLELKRSITENDYRKDGKLLANAPKPSEEQKKWIQELDKIENVRSTVAYGLKEAIRIVEESEEL